MDGRGFALPFALLLLLALGFVATGAANFALTGQRIAINYDAFHRALDVAEAGLERGVEALAAAYEKGVAVPDSLTAVAGDSLNGFAYDVRIDARREHPAADLNGNGIAGEIVRYDRSWGFADAAAAGGPVDPGEPVREIRSRALGRAAGEELLMEVGLERDPSVTDPLARGAWRVVPLRWTSLDP